MEANKSKPVGAIRVSDAVIVKIAEVAATEIEGVDCSGQALTPVNPKAKMFSKSVKVKLTGESVAIAIDLVVKEGFNAVTVAENVQKSVKSAVQSMTGFTVTKVDVRIAGIKFNK